MGGEEGERFGEAGHAGVVAGDVQQGAAVLGAAAGEQEGVEAFGGAVDGRRSSGRGASPFSAAWRMARSMGLSASGGIGWRPVSQSARMASGWSMTASRASSSASVKACEAGADEAADQDVVLVGAAMGGAEQDAGGAGRGRSWRQGMLSVRPGRTFGAVRAAHIRFGLPTVSPWIRCSAPLGAPHQPARRRPGAGREDRARGRGASGCWTCCSTCRRAISTAATRR